MLTESDENECDYKRVLKENEELKKSKITYEKVRDIQEKNKNIVDKNYISKQIIKDKIEEVKEFSENAISSVGHQLTIEILQELLEGRK